MDVLIDAARSLFADWVAMKDLLPRAAVATLALGIPAAWIWETVRYAVLLGDRDRVHLAPIRVHGPLLSAMGGRGVAQALEGELSTIGQAQRMLAGKPAPYIAPATGRDQGYYLVGLRRDVPLPARVSDDPSLGRIEQEITLEIGSVKIPISGLVNLMTALLGAVFVPFRNVYRRSLIHISLVAHDKQTRLTVHLPARRYAGDLPRWWHMPTFLTPARWTLRGLAHRTSLPETARARCAAFAGAISWPRREKSELFTVTRPTEDLTQVAAILRDAAFMVDALHRRDGCNWRSRRRLFDGLDALGDYYRSASDEARSAAQEAFRDAAALDPQHNYHALYFHGVMTMVTRTAESIDEALVHFQAALAQTAKSEQPLRPLRALIETGLAYCHAQRVHRLGQSADATLAVAYEHARHAERAWREAYDHGELIGARHPHPLIPYTYGLVIGVDERDGLHRLSDELIYDRVGRRLAACRHFHRAAQIDHDNPMFYNNLGWTLLKLLEIGVDHVPTDLALETLTGPAAGHPPWVADEPWARLPRAVPPETIPTATTAAEYLRYALQLQPRNKLTHANLALLYSMPPFRDLDRESFYARARYHGKKAIQLDPHYINGHRDFAIAVLRYRKNRREAKQLYYDALRLAEHPDKDRELIDQVVRELKDAYPKIPAKELKSWERPHIELLEPREEGEVLEEG